MASPPTQRCSPTLCTFIDEYILVIGGFNRKHSAIGLSTIDIYDIWTDSWLPGPKMPQERFNMGACVHGDFLYISCGFSLGNCLQDMIRINIFKFIAQKTPKYCWESLYHRRWRLTPRESPIMCPLNATEILIMGGQHFHQKLCDAFIFDLKDNQLKTVISDETDPLTKRTSLKFAGVGNQCVQVREGEIAALVTDEF